MTTRPDPAADLVHGPAARFVEQILALDGATIVCRGRIPVDSPATVEGEAGTWAALELAAQSAALLQAAGAETSDGAADNHDPASGYLVRVKSARFRRPTVPAGVDLVARVERIGGAGALSLFAATIELAGQVVATASLGTFATPVA